MNKLILIAGASATGKSRYAKHLINTINIPVISKDSIKEVMHDGLHFTAETVEQTQYYGACAYKLFCETALGNRTSQKSNSKFLPFFCPQHTVLQS